MEQKKESLNAGVWQVNPSQAGPYATIGATGLGRSGTTMVARILGGLGVYMGDKLTPRTYEDKEFQTLIKARDFRGFELLCRKRDAEKPKWGFKCPALRGDIQGFASLMREPRFIVTFRDPLAIALRNNLALQEDVMKALRKAVKGTQSMVAQISKCDAPFLLISYEKALQFPQETVREIASFCGIDVDEKLVEDCVEVIRNGDPKYLSDTPLG